MLHAIYGPVCALAIFISLPRAADRDRRSMPEAHPAPKLPVGALVTGRVLRLRR
jgi:hypothetical protein